MERFNFKRVARGCILLLAVSCSLAAAANAADITLAWDKPAEPVHGYNVYYGKSGTEFKAAPQLTINNPDETSCVLTGLEPGALYGFTITSTDSKGVESAFSEELFFNVGENGEALLNDEWTETDLTSAGGSGGAAAKGKGKAAVEVMSIANLKDGFHTVQMLDNAGFATGFMNVTFDGAGALVCEEVAKSAAAADASGMGTTYTVAGGGALAIDGVEQGAISADGSFFTAGRMAGTPAPRMMFGIKAAAGNSVANLNGAYKLFMFASQPDPATGAPVVTTSAASVTADGQGNLTPADGGFAATCVVDASTGIMDITPAATYSQMMGALSPDGGIFTAVDTDASDGTLLFVIGIKGATELAQVNLAGSFHVNEFEYDTPTGGPIGSFAKLSVGSDGAYTVEEIANSCDCPPESASGTMTPGANGEIQAVDATTSETSSGGLAPNGAIFTALKEQSMSVGIRQPAAATPVSEESDGGGGGGGGGGCFIGTLF